MSINIKDWYQYMDGSKDAEAIILEVARLSSFDSIAKEINTIQILYDLVRDVWEIAYSYGRHDALAEEGLTLAEIEESGE